MAKSGYTLPVFACASTIAALQYLQQQKYSKTVSVDLISPPERAIIAIEQVALIAPNKALAITKSKPGDNLDLTKDTPVWALVEIASYSSTDSPVTIRGGDGIGKQVNAGARAAIYSYAQQLIEHNLNLLRSPNERLITTIILPEGRQLATRTSNAAFGVVEGLSLLGTSGVSQPLSSPEQLAVFQSELSAKAKQYKTLVFCVGENGLDLAEKLGIKRQQLVKTANWLGSMLVAAAVAEVETILLFGYHGKLIKLAGGIFHTHHHLADGRREILTAHCALMDLPQKLVQQIWRSPTAEDSLQMLKKFDPILTEKIYSNIVETIDRRCEEYVSKHGNFQLKVGCILFDRQRQIIIKSLNGCTLLAQLC